MDVEGSFLVIADNVLGHFIEEKTPFTNHDGEEANGNGSSHPHHEEEHVELAHKKLIFSDRCGKIRLRNVTIRNQGIDWSHSSNAYWKHKVERKEACRVVLHGEAIFEAADVELRGDVTYEVPDGYKMVVSADNGVELTQINGGDNNGDGSANGDTGSSSWQWKYSMPDSFFENNNNNNTIQLELMD
jgi:hypothetical protein